MFVSAERLAGATGSVQHTIDGETSLVELGDWGARLAADPEGDPDASLTTDGATWTLPAWRKLPLVEAEAQGRLQIAGDRALAERYLAAFATP